MKDLRQVLISGISSDLGTVLASELSRDPGTLVIGTMRRGLAAHERFGDNVIIVDNCDLVEAQDCARLADIVAREFDEPFGCIHSVGDFWNHVPFKEVTPSEARHTFESHVVTLYNLMYALIPLMEERGGGSSIALSCQSIVHNYPWMAAYTAAKSSVASLMKSLCNEFSGRGMRFNSLALASLKTPKVVESKPHGDINHFTAPVDLVPTISFLLSSGARLVNGNTISLFEPSDTFHAEYFRRVSK